MTQPPVPAPQLLNAADARNALAALSKAMDNLLYILDEETALIRDGHVAKAVELESQKAEFSRVYMAYNASVKANRELLAQLEPEALRAVAGRHAEMRDALQTNMTVVATAHAVSEGIIRGVSGELARKTQPSTYGAGGRANAPSPRTTQPLAVSRSI